MLGDLLKRYDAREMGSLDSTTLTKARLAAKYSCRHVVRKDRSWVSSRSSPTARPSVVVSRLFNSKSVTRRLDLDMKSKTHSIFDFKDG